ncbi:hypothetical protein [Salinispora mooreana]|uniref:hypothetical protein n=1 Tax=Salinispora mooreana TaxID=999545 RepID=UPI0013A59A64|nr:hypothetical protein [Salinispora mooreana]
MVNHPPEAPYKHVGATGFPGPAVCLDGAVVGNTGVTLADSRIVDDAALAGNGGRVFVNEGAAGNQVAIRHSEISRNRALGAGAVAGGVYSGATNALVCSDVKITRNSSAEPPDGVYNAGTVTVVGPALLVSNSPHQLRRQPEPGAHLLRLTHLGRINRPAALPAGRASYDGCRGSGGNWRSCGRRCATPATWTATSNTEPIRATV